MSAAEWFAARCAVSYGPSESPEHARERIGAELAAAELAAGERSWSVEWEHDRDGMCDHESDARWRGGSVPSTCEQAVLSDESGRVLAVLCCVDDADDDYRRVIAAELFALTLADGAA